MSHASKLSVVFRDHGDPFVEEVRDEVCNLLAKEIIYEKAPPKPKAKAAKVPKQRAAPPPREVPPPKNPFFCY